MTRQHSKFQISNSKICRTKARWKSQINLNCRDSSASFEMRCHSEPFAVILSAAKSLS
jgi:hypothetical protein